MVFSAREWRAKVSWRCRRTLKAEETSRDDVAMASLCGAITAGALGTFLPHFWGRLVIVTTGAGRQLIASEGFGIHTGCVGKMLFLKSLFRGFVRVVVITGDSVLHTTIASGYLLSARLL